MRKLALLLVLLLVALAAIVVGLILTLRPSIFSISADDDGLVILISGLVALVLGVPGFLVNLLVLWRQLGSGSETTPPSIPPAIINPLHSIPEPVQNFVGRTREIEEILADVRARSVAVAVIYGLGGVGKTELAHVLASQLKNEYRDADIEVDLRGTSEQEPITTAQAMEYVIRAFVPGAQLPDDLNELGRIFQSVLAEKRVLLLLDNARDLDQVQPLATRLPQGCAAIITSRQRFQVSGFDFWELRRVEEQDALDLISSFASHVGEDRAKELAELCGYLPLALQISASALGADSNISPERYISRLRDRGIEDRVEASLSLSYGLLRPQVARSFRALAVFPQDFSSGAAAFVWDVSEDESELTLSKLMRYSLVEYQTTTHRYSLHDVVRVFAGERLASPQNLFSKTLRALTRAIGRSSFGPSEAKSVHYRHSLYYMAVLSATNRAYLEGGDGVLAGLRLFDLERGNIEAGQSWAAANVNLNAEVAELCRNYPNAGVYVLNLRLHSNEWILWLESAVSAARNLGDEKYEGAHLANLGQAYIDLGEYHKAIECYTQALDIAREIGDRHIEGSALGSLGLAYDSLGEYQKAIEYYTQALDIAHEIGDRRGEGNRLGNLGNAYANLGEYQKAVEHHTQTLDIAREIGDRRIEGIAQGSLGSVYSSLGEYHRAIDYHTQALDMAREIGDRRGEGNDLGNLGSANFFLGEYHRAIDYHTQALDIAREIGDRRGESNRLGNLGIAYASLGEYQTAIEHHIQALDISREIGDRRGEGNDLGNLGIAYSNLGEYQTAIEYHTQALDISREIGDRGGEGNRLGNLGIAYASLGEYQTAIDYYTQALGFSREIGDRLAEGNQLGNLGSAYAALGEDRKATESVEQALAIFEALGVPQVEQARTQLEQLRQQAGAE